MFESTLSGKRILLLGSNERAALSVCRSLGRQGATVEIATIDPVRQPAELSRYCRRRIFFGSPVADLAGVRAALAALVATGRYDAIFPITDLACELVHADHAALAAHAVIVGPAPDAYLRAVDKAQALEIARQVGGLANRVGGGDLDCRALPPQRPADRQRSPLVAAKQQDALAGKGAVRHR